MIAENGVGGLTHRKVAEAADVPVGSTTYYFTDLDDLINATLTHAAEACAACLTDWARVLDAATDLPAALAELTVEYLADRDRHRALNELYTAATHRPELRPTARMWTEGLIALLTPRIGARSARAVAVFMDGVLLHTLITDEPVSVAELTGALAALLTIPDADGR